MSASKEIRTKILSIKKTQKITSAMQMVAASKMRKAQQRMEISEPYANKIRTVMGHVAGSHSEYKHYYLQPREEVANVGYIVVGTDRGLCGGLNINLFRVLLQDIKEWHSKEANVRLCLFGGKAVNYFKYLGFEVMAKAQGFSDHPTVADLVGGVTTMIEAYNKQQLDRLFIVYNRFVNKMVYKPQILQLLPLELVDSGNKEKYWDYIYEPDPKSLLDTLIVRYLETQVYQAVVDNLACEEAARMLAMKNATDSATKLIVDLNLVYNKARQAAITQEIAEIISGASVGESF